MRPLRTVALAAPVAAPRAAVLTVAAGLAGAHTHTGVSIVVCTGTAPVDNPAFAQASRPRRDHGHVGT
jgi:hypothetical protein